MFATGYRNAKGISSVLHLSGGETEAKKYVNGIPGLKGIAKNLDIIIDILTDFAEFDPDVARKIKPLEDAKNTILNCIEKEVIYINPDEAADRMITNDMVLSNPAVPDMEETDTEEKKVIPPFKIDIARELEKIGKRKRK